MAKRSTTRHTKATTPASRRRKVAARPLAHRRGKSAWTPRIVAYIAASLDGYIATRDGGVAWLAPYADALAGFREFIRSVGHLVMGRTTYEFAGTEPYGKLPVHVLTSRPLVGAPAGVAPYCGDVRVLADTLRAKRTGDVWLVGGGRVIRDFLDADLVDHWRLFVVPVLLADGVPLFPVCHRATRHLRLVGTRTYGSGVVELRYDRATPPS